MSKISVETNYTIEWEVSKKEASALTRALYKCFAQAYGQSQELILEADEQAILQSLMECAEGVGDNT